MAYYLTAVAGFGFGEGLLEERLKFAPVIIPVNAILCGAFATVFCKP